VTAGECTFRLKHHDSESKIFTLQKTKRKLISFPFLKLSGHRIGTWQFIKVLRKEDDVLLEKA
jgi:hypothetical protein